MSRYARAAIIAFIAAFDCAYATEFVEYRGWLNDAVIRFEIPINGSSKGRVRIARDMVAPVEYCAVESDFFCIQSIVLSFAFPRSGVEGQSEWTFGGWIFKVLDADLTISLLGQVRAGLTLVEVPPGASLNGRQSGKPTLVLYSRASGIVGFASEFLPEGSPTPTYWLASEVGLGANQWNEQ